MPFAATVRVQLVDLIASLWWLASQEPAAALPDRALENAALRSGRRDYYYDLSRKETDRLEAPFWITPAFPGESVSTAFERMAGAAGRILAGEQVFRPLAIEASLNPLKSIGDGLQRGGNTFVFDVESLKLAPNPSPVIDRRPSRRADMVWALLQKRYFSRQVVTLPFALYHDRSHAAAAELDVAHIVDDIRGYAMFSALEDISGVFRLTTDDRGIRLSEEMVECFAQRVHKYLKERLAAFRLSFYRILGLTCVLRRLVDDEENWWQGDEYRDAVKQLRTLSERLADCYEMETLYRIEREAKALDARRIREFLEQLPVEIESHRSRLSDFSALAHSLEAERVANAKTVAVRLASPAGPLAVLGYGKEGVALSDGTHVFKVFDYCWKLLRRGRDNLRFTHDRSDILAAGPFDLVVCRRVLCTIEDNAELRVVLSDLRASVSEYGRVVVTVCDPHFTFGGPTPEADRDLPPNAQYESTFAWRKRVRTTGRVRREVHRPERALRREFARAGSGGVPPRRSADG